ncbi:MAG: flavin reductase family protein [Oscillospiraceae bacterium]|nr:flavin reductase family protein [Oscillospiraceae bacterium]
MNKTRFKAPFRPVYPSPAGLIVSIDENGKNNVMTAGEIFNIGLRNPTIIGIALRKAVYTHSLIVRSGEFTVNFATAAMIDKVDLVGTISGRDGLDKFSEYGLTPIASAEVKPAIILECPVNLECKLLNVTVVGDHDLMLGEVLAMHVDSDKMELRGGRERMVVEKLDAFLFAEGEYFRVGEKIGYQGFTRKRID